MSGCQEKKKSLSGPLAPWPPGSQLEVYMNILAIDTASSVCSVAVSRDDMIVAEKTIDSGIKHSESLLPMIEEVIKASNIDKNDIHIVIASKGPGSFTGLRIGVTVANTFAQVLGIPAVGVSTLDEIAISANKTDEIICPIIDAKGGKVYGALYKNKDKLERISEYSLYDSDKLPDAIYIKEENLRAANLIKYYLENKDKISLENKYITPMYIKKSQADE